MIRPLTTQTSFLAQSGQLEFYRSGKAGQFRNDGDVRQIDGFAIDVAGSTSKLVRSATFEPGAGVNVVKREGPPSLLAPSTLAASIELQAMPNFSKAEIAAAKALGGNGYVTSVGEVTEMHFTPIGAEPQSVEGLGFLLGDVLQGGGRIDYVKRQIARSGELARIEGDLSAEYGADVKLAFDPMAEEYVMLRPGQFGYDRVKSAREVFVQVVQDVPKMGDGDAYRDVLAQYGVG
jgi:hypothetical protein